MEGIEKSSASAEGPAQAGGSFGRVPGVKMAPSMDGVPGLIFSTCIVGFVIDLMFILIYI